VRKQMAGLLRASRRQNGEEHQTGCDQSTNGLHVPSSNGAANCFL